METVFTKGDIPLTLIYFVRHSHSVYSTDEYGRGLSERGKDDTGQVAGTI